PTQHQRRVVQPFTRRPALGLSSPLEFIKQGRLVGRNGASCRNRRRNVGKPQPLRRSIRLSSANDFRQFCHQGISSTSGPFMSPPVTRYGLPFTSMTWPTVYAPAPGSGTLRLGTTLLGTDDPNQPPSFPGWMSVSSSSACITAICAF